MLFLIGVAPDVRRGAIYNISEHFLIESIAAVIGVVILLGGTALWGWSRKRIVLGVISTIVAGVFLLMSINFAIMKLVSFKLGNELLHVSIIWPLVFGIIFVTIGIVLIVKQRKIDVVATKKPI